jgi:hypothetical protein
LGNVCGEMARNESDPKPTASQRAGGECRRRFVIADFQSALSADKVLNIAKFAIG